MTTVRVTTFGTGLSTPQKATIADRITAAFADVEVGEDNELIRSGFSVLFESAASKPPRSVASGGRLSSPCA